MKNSPDPTAKTGLDHIIEAYKIDIDRTLIRENLRLTVDQCFQQLMECSNQESRFKNLKS
jgi:hypothetical protein